MKKILVCLICIIVFSPIAFASKETDEIKKILPFKYERVRKIKADKKIAYAGENSAFISLYSPDGLYDNFMQTYYSQNNKLQNIKFENYPSEAVIRYKQGGKYGIIYVQGDFIHITKPVFDKVEFPDDNSIAGRILNVSFAPLDNIILYAKYPYRNFGGEYLYQSAKMLFYISPYAYHKGYVFLNPAQVKENIRVENNNLYVKYEQILFPKSEFAITLAGKNINLYNLKTFKKIEYKNINLAQMTQMPIIDSLSGLYEFINMNTAFKLNNYPLDGMMKIANKLYLFKNGQMQRLKGIYDDFKLTGDDLYINRLTGLNLSFQSDDNIIAKHGEKWGIVNSNGEIKVPFAYDEIYVLSANIEENISNIGDIDTQKLELDYISSETPETIYIARNGRKYGVINDNNEILVPFEYIKYSEDNDLNAVKSQIGITTQKELQRQNRKEIIHSLPWFITSIILYPLWLVMPYPSLNINIDY